VRKTSPYRAGTLADLLAVMQTDLRRIEVALREVAIQASFLGVARRGGAAIGARGPYPAAPDPAPEFAPGRITSMHGPGGHERVG